MRIDVDAGGALIKLGEIQDLMDVLQGIDVNWMGAIHFEDFRGNDFAGAVSGVFLLNPEILYS